MGVFQDEIPQGTGSLDEGGGTRCTWEMKVKVKDFDRNKLDTSWRIILVSKYLVTPIYKPIRPFVRGTTLLRGLTNHGY